MVYLFYQGLHVILIYLIGEVSITKDLDSLHFISKELLMWILFIIIILRPINISFKILFQKYAPEELDGNKNTIEGAGAMPQSFLNNQISVEKSAEESTFINEEDLLEAEQMKEIPMVESVAITMGGGAAAAKMVSVVVAAGEYVIHKASEYRKNKRRSTYDKHTKPCMAEVVKRKSKNEVGNLENGVHL